MKIKYPKNEIPWVSYIGSDGQTVCVLTSNKTREYYYLYKVLPDGSLEKLGKAKTPPELEKKYDVLSLMRKENNKVEKRK